MVLFLQKIKDFTEREPKRGRPGESKSAGKHRKTP